MALRVISSESFEMQIRVMQELSSKKKWGAVVAKDNRRCREGRVYVLCAVTLSAVTTRKSAQMNDSNKNSIDLLK